MARRMVGVGHGNFDRTFPAAPVFSAGAGANEPAGLSQLVHETCDSTTLTTAGWNDPNLDNKTQIQIVTDSDMPSGKAVEFRWPEGHADGITDWVVWNGATGYSEVYFRFVLRFNPGWQGHSSGANKLMFYTYPDAAAKFYPWVRGLNSPNARLAWRDQTGNGDEFEVYAEHAAEGGFQWGDVVECEFHHKAQSAVGVADGELHGWMNGTKITEWRQMGFEGPLKTLSPANFIGGTATSPNITLGFQWKPFWGGSGDTKTVAPYDWLRFGDLYISGKAA